ncbi:hypothetical protein [Solimonas terrae]|uniref:Uncharacterized protein n=1 Tax=Solimonas terrae TaxID=1396819 RepID=A0A6M2BL03_9GAMM|nr:hypothetical protein [Solimonas terrae]NGY03194.1 hypothetical protein [Solimonas terrae]
MNTTPRRSSFGIEILLLIVLPAAVLIAGAFTATLAFRGGFTPLPEPAGFVVQAH